ncbi:HU family DNA-binding protein [Parabacteroides sp. 52]|uniref:HU family DNA-binding protein n=1 Tax=unclassified Parabacteroides TaxID=2649774 RepID=UPI0013D3E048|nr:MULTISPECIES: HU family DNA-binding protein [unclassified Parabacteroides]MDH6534639.1 DNA-binding protein HU-beta [Parabacteroides sp. PM5-20]NDV55130.1 HU family DNA-binding protein [Parabacteroides sp. 52]
MNKADLAKSVAKRLSVSKAESYEFISAMQEVLTDELQQNGYIILQGFGVFSSWQQTERMGRNPKTGEECRIESRTSVKFKPGKALLEALNQERNQLKKEGI